MRPGHGAGLFGAIAAATSVAIRQRRARCRAVGPRGGHREETSPAEPVAPEAARSPAEAALDIAYTGVQAADPYLAVRKAMVCEGEALRIHGTDVDLRPFRRVVVVGAGKAVVPMARAVEAVLGPSIAEGLVVTKYGHAAAAGPLHRISVREGAHPVPDAASAAATQSILELARGAGKDTLLLVLISGGASSLLCAPAPPLSLADLRATSEALLASGASIGEMNAVRKHLEAAKGGARAAAAAIFRDQRPSPIPPTARTQADWQRRRGPRACSRWR